MMAPDEQTTTQRNDPSGYLTGGGYVNGRWQYTPGYNNLLANVNRLLGTGFEDQIRGAMREGKVSERLYNRGANQSPLTGAGANYIQNILGGGGMGGASNPYLNQGNPYLNAQNQGVTGNTLGTAQSVIGGAGLSPDSNPYLKQTFDRAAQATRGQLASEFAGGGRDLAASAPARSDQLQTLASNIYGGNYQAERGRQANMTGQSLGLGQQNLGNQRGNFLQNLMSQRGTYNQGMDMGLRQQGLALGSALPFANQDYTNIQAMMQAASNPVNNLINRISAVAPAMGGTAISSQPVYNDPISGALGGHPRLVGAAQGHRCTNGLYRHL
jgi:hypothetical protein